MTDDLTGRSRERVRQLRDRLEREYGEVPVVKKTWRHPPRFYDDLVERFEAGTAGGAGAWVYDDEARVLLVREANSPGWSDPGGKRTPGETFEETAVRRVREAAGVEVTITGVVELHAIDLYDGTDPDRPTLVEPIVTFEARYESGSPEPGPDGAGVAEVDWFTEHPPATTYEDVDRRPIPYTPGRE